MCCIIILPRNFCFVYQYFTFSCCSYPVSEVTRINSEACEKQTMATVECAEKQLMLLSQASYVSDDEDALK